MSNAKDIKITKLPISVNGEDKVLVFDLNAFIEIEDTYGDIEGALTAVEKGSMKALRLLLWAGMLHEQPTISQREVGAMFDMQGLAQIGPVVFEGLTIAMPNKDSVVEQKAQNIDPNVQVPVNVLAKPTN